MLISDGILYEENMVKTDTDYNTLLCMLQAKGINDISEVFAAFYDGKSMFHVYPMPQHKQNFSGEVY